MGIIASGPGDIRRAYTKYYSRLADHFVRQIGQTRFRVVLEAGCGRGQLTIPLLEKLPAGVKLIAVDSSTGPYKGWLPELVLNLEESGMEDRVRVFESDVRKMRDVKRNSVDIIVSNELLCDLVPERRLVRALQEFWRVLRPGGIMIHGEWSSHNETGDKSLLVKHSPSWTPDQLHSAMFQSGFRKFQVTYFETTIVFGFEAGVEEVRAWGASSGLLKALSNMLRKEGLRLPFEHVIRCEKAGPRRLSHSD